MVLTLLQNLYQDNLDKLEHLLADGSYIVEHGDLAGLIQASWMRLKNWGIDIKRGEKDTLELLPTIDKQTSQIVQRRLLALLKSIDLVESQDLAQARDRDKMRYSSSFIDAISCLFNIYNKLLERRLPALEI
jgi:hypothetical protein